MGGSAQRTNGLWYVTKSALFAIIVILTNSVDSKVVEYAER
jgi:hypothetical protein